MYRLISARQIDVTPHKAESLLKFNTFVGQRAMSPRTITTYADLMKAGRFRVAEIGMAVLPDGTMYLVNGQQTCHAGVLSQETFKASYQEYACDTDQDLWMLYGSFDVHRARSEGNIIKSAQNLYKHEELHSVPIKVLQLSAASLLYLGKGTSPNFATRPATKTDKALLPDENKDDVLLLNDYCSLWGRVLKVGVAVALLATFRKNPNKAVAFWDRVLVGDKLERGTPQYQLHKFLTLDNGATTTGYAGHVLRYAKCIAWWNSFVEGKPRHAVTVQAMKSLPEVKG